MLQLNRIQSHRTGLTRGREVLGEAEVEVVFGTPSRNCEGMGVCMVMDRRLKRTTIICPHALAHLRCYENGLIEFRFPKERLPESIQARYFDVSGFPVEEPFHLPSRLARRWGMKKPWIWPGIYPLIETPTEWLLWFQIDSEIIDIQ